jgi:two-component system CheB/CheR fusion protein
MSPALKSDATFEHLLEYLRQSRGFDFSAYKRPSLMRRVAKRMQDVDVENFADYVDYLEVHPEEFAFLFNTILINVTSFFRDPAAWKHLGELIESRLLTALGPQAPIRVWSAGCASGEEAYTIAMILAEALGKEAFKRRVKIYATDADEDALVIARLGAYGDKEMQPLPQELRDKYFDKPAGRYTFNSEMRRTIIFGRHDLVQDAPMSHLDLLVCRNTLMYLNSETQARIVRRFNYALNPHGLLFLGKAEMLLAHSTLFAPIEMKYRIFSRTTPTSLRDRLMIFSQNNAAEINDNAGRDARLRDMAFDSADSAKIVIDTNHILTLVNQQARQLFSIEARDIGRPFQDLELSYQPLELRSLIEKACTEHKSVRIDEVERRFRNGDTHYLGVDVVPLEENGVAVGVCITFYDMTEYHNLEEEVQRARQDAETVNEELQATNEELQSTNEELETTNEELQSTNEELETTNEELQSTNEELETMNEELQSTNEELHSINEELGERTAELDNSNSFLRSILSSLRGGIAVVDRNINVLVWNLVAEDMWGLRFDEVKGQSLLNLDIGLPVGRLKTQILSCLNDGAEPQELILDAVNRRGRSIKCHVSITPLKGPQGARQGAMIIMEEMGM